jgi:hypothetical protein
LIGRKIDLDLLSLFPQKDLRNMGGMERESKLLKVNNGGEREGVATSPRRKKGAFYRSSHENSCCRPLSPESPALGGRRLRAGAKKPPPPSLH